MNPTTFLNILRSIAIHHKPGDLCRRLNSFMVLDRMSQLNSNNADMTMQHYNEGLYWARDWFNEGQSPNNICIEYDTLVIEPPKMAVADMFDPKALLTHFVSVVGRVACENCDCKDTIEGKRIAVMQTMLEVKRELFAFWKYDVTLADTTTAAMWATPAQKDYLITDGAWLSARQIESISSYVQLQTVEIYVPEWNSLRPSFSQSTGKTTLVDNVVALTMRVDVTTCEPEPAVSFDYDRPDVAALGVVKCDVC